jgi:hypothetical protein
VELALIGALVAVARARIGNNTVSRTIDGKQGAFNVANLVLPNKFGSRISGDASAIGVKGFPARELSLAAILALTGAAKGRPWTELTEPLKNAVRIERSLEGLSRRKEEKPVPGPVQEPVSIDSPPRTKPEASENVLGDQLPELELVGVDRKEEQVSAVLAGARIDQDILEEETADIIESYNFEPTDESEDENGTSATVLYRPTWLINKGETLVSIAESLFQDANLGWLIADLNRERLKESFEDGKRIVEVRTREKLELPVAQDIVAFYRDRPKHADPDNLITIVVERHLDRQIVDGQLNMILGGLKSSVKW